MLKYCNSHTGLTLVEMLIALAMFTLLSIVVMNGIQRMYIYNAYTFAQAYQVQNARIGLQTMIRDIREMTFADNGTFPLAVMEANEIGFYSDIDRDDSVEYVEYLYADTTTLIKNVYNAVGTPATYDLTTPDETYTLSYYVQNIDQATSTFFYFRADGTEVTTASDLTDVRYIKGQVIINIEPVRDPGQFMLRSSAALRNVQENV